LLGRVGRQVPLVSQPFLGDGAEGVAIRRALSATLGARVDASPQQLAEIVTVILGLLNPDLRKLPKRKRLLPAQIPVPEAPPAAIVRHDEDV